MEKGNSATEKPRDNDSNGFQLNKSCEIVENDPNAVGNRGNIIDDGRYNNKNNNAKHTLDTDVDVAPSAYHLLSRRCLETAGSQTAVTNFMFTARSRWSENAFDEDANPAGIVNVGTAENKVCADVIDAKIKEISLRILASNVSHSNYFDFRGMKHVRIKVANFLERYFARRHRDCLNHQTKVDSSHVFITNGCGPGLDILAHVIADEGDVILSPTPHYRRIENNFQERGLVGTIYVPLSSEKLWTLTVEDVKRGYDSAAVEGKKVRGLILVNPHNPLGSVLDRGTMWSILQFCRDHQIHVIFDEIYRLCVFKGRLSECTSILQFGKNVPDPERTHFVWSMSKDFGMSGYRFGVIYTHSQVMAKALSCFSYFTAVPSLVQDIVGEMLSDDEWIDHTFLPESNKRFKVHRSMVASTFERAGISFYHGAKGGLFVWAFIGDFLKENTFEAEREFAQYLMEERGCYVLPGCEMSCPEPGWIRVVFTVSTLELETFLFRFTEALRPEDGSCGGGRACLEGCHCQDDRGERGSEGESGRNSEGGSGGDEPEDRVDGKEGGRGGQRGEASVGGGEGERKSRVEEEISVDKDEKRKSRIEEAISIDKDEKRKRMEGEAEGRIQKKRGGAEAFKSRNKKFIAEEEGEEQEQECLELVLPEEHQASSVVEAEEEDMTQDEEAREELPRNEESGNWKRMEGELEAEVVEEEKEEDRDVKEEPTRREDNENSRKEKQEVEEEGEERNAYGEERKEEAKRKSEEGKAYFSAATSSIDAAAAQQASTFASAYSLALGTSGATAAFEERNGTSREPTSRFRFVPRRPESGRGRTGEDDFQWRRGFFE